MKQMIQFAQFDEKYEARDRCPKYTVYLLFHHRLYQNGNDPRKPNEGKITLLHLWTRGLAKVEMKQFTKSCSNATLSEKGK